MWVQGKRLIFSELEFDLLSGEDNKLYEELSYKFKFKIVAEKLEQITEMIGKVYGVNKVEALAEHIVNHPELLDYAINQVGKIVKVREDFKVLNRLDDKEFKEFSRILKEKIIQKELGVALGTE